MEEAALKEFFCGRVTATELAQDIEGAAVRSGHDVTYYSISDMDEEFEVTVEQLARLCRAVVDGQLPPQALDPVGNCLLFSEHFHWEGEAGQRVFEVAQCWAVPPVNYSLTVANAAKFEQWLLTGKNTLKAHPIGA